MRVELFGSLTDERDVDGSELRPCSVEHFETRVQILPREIVLPLFFYVVYRAVDAMEEIVSLCDGGLKLDHDGCGEWRRTIGERTESLMRRHTRREKSSSKFTEFAR